MSVEQMDMVRERICKRFPIYAQKLFPELPSGALAPKLDVRIDAVATELVITLSAFMLKEVEEERVLYFTFKFPASPWDFFKEKYFPSWLLRWFPIKFEAINREATAELSTVFPVLPDGFPRRIQNCLGRRLFSLEER